MSYGTGTGGAGTYGVNVSESVASGTITANGSIGSSGSPASMYAYEGYYGSAAPGAVAGGGTFTPHPQATIGDFINLIGASKDATVELLGNSDSGWGGNIANVGMFQGAPFPMTASGAPSPTGMSALCTKTQDFQAWASTYGGQWRSLYQLSDGGVWADSSVAQFTGSISGAALTVNSVQTGSLPTVTAGSPVVYICGPGITGSPSTCPTIASGSGSSYTLNTSGGTVSNVAMTAGTYKPATPLGTSSFNGQIAGSTLTVNSITNTASFTGSLSGNTLAVSGVTGTLAIGQCVTDGGVNIRPLYPLCITGGGSPNWTVNNASNYYPSISAEPMTSTQTAIIPGQYVNGAGITTPVQVRGYGSGNGGVGTYMLSNSANGTVAAEAMTMSGISAGGAIAPGAALTIDDPGIGAIYPITNGGALTGALKLAGAYNVGLLRGTPSFIQAQISATPGGPAVSGCSACAWTNLTGAAPSGGSWSGSVVNIPAGGPYWVSIRAANGASYATLPNAVFVGATVAGFGEGNAAAQLTPGASSQSYYTGFSQLSGFSTGGTGGTQQTNGVFVPGPAILNSFSPSFAPQMLVDRFGVFGGATASVDDGLAWLTQNASSALGGAPVGVANMTKNGSGFQNIFFSNTPQTQTIGVGDGSTTTFSSGAGFGGSAGGTSATLARFAGSISGNTLSATIGTGYAYLGVGQVITCGSCAAGTVITGPGAGGGGGAYPVSPSQTVASQTMTATYNNLAFTGALGYGATITGSVSSATLTVGALNTGALAPLMTVSDGSHTATLNACLTNCGPFAGAASTWQLSNASLSGDTGAAMTVTPPGGVLWPTPTPLTSGVPVDSTSGNGNGNNPIIKVGTFQVLVNGAVVCTDSHTFAYNIQVGNCTGAGMSSAWVNYSTGAYSITFASAPANNAAIVAQWTNIISSDYAGNEQLDWVGDGTKTGGILSSVAANTGGINAYLMGQQGPGGWPLPYLTFAHQMNYVFGTAFARLHNGQTNQPMLTTGQWRGEGPTAFYGYFSYGSDPDLDQYDQDAATNSTFSGTVSSAGGSTATLTLSGAAVGPMWEGEAIECNPYSASCALPLGAEIVSLATGTWGASGSTYNLTTASGSFPTSFTGPMHNAMWYTPGNAAYVGPYNDLSMASGSGGIGGYSVETGGGIAGALRYGHRVGAETGAALSGNPAKAETPTLFRTTFTGCDGSATASPCFDVGNTYAASASGAISGSTVTFSGGLAAGSRPFVPGMVLSCSGCTSGRVVTAVSLPPTQSTATGAGQVGQTFTVTASGSLGVSTTETVAGGCSGTAGTGSNCIDISVQINTTGTYGTAAALATCGVNNLVGTNTNSPSGGVYIYPNGACQPTGVGALVRGFRIGTTQLMDTLGTPGSSVYDFGADPNIANGQTTCNSSGNCGLIYQNEAFTCNIVAATKLQCVKGPTYSNGAFSSIGEWLSGQTYVSYGDPYAATGFLGGLIGYPGGQSFPFTPGSGYANGNYATGGVCTLVSGGVAPAMGFSIAGGSIVNVYPTAIGNGADTQCTFPLTFTFTGVVTGYNSTAHTANLAVSALSGGLMVPGEVITNTSGTAWTGTIVSGSLLGTAGTYVVSTTSGNVSSEGMMSGPPAGSGGSITTPPIGPLEGVGGIGSYDSDSNLMGTLMYDNSGLAGNPLAGFFALPAGGLESPGLPVRPWGMRRGAQVSG